MDAVITKGIIRGEMVAPPSKSAAHRAVLCAALASGISKISNMEYSADVRATLDAVSQLGATVEERGSEVYITGIGGRFTPKITKPVFCNESGSTLRFLVPLFSMTGQAVRFTGAPRLFKRPQQVYRDLFSSQNLPFNQDETGIAIAGALCPGEFTLRGDISSQFVSGLLLATPFMKGDSIIRVLPPYESHSYVLLTLEMMRRFGLRAEETLTADGGALYHVPGGQTATACDVTVEGDFSQVAFPAVLGGICGNLLLRGLNMRSRQGDKVIFDILKRCHAKCFAAGNTAIFGSPEPMYATTVDLSDCPDLGPILMVLACFCQGETVIENAGRLRMKESDRIATMEWELSKFGASITSDENTIHIKGVPLHQPELPLCGNNDHRVVMSLAVAALGGGFTVTIQGAEAVRKSWPGFFEDIQKLGAKVVLSNG